MLCILIIVRKRGLKMSEKEMVLSLQTVNGSEDGEAAPASTVTTFTVTTTVIGWSTASNRC